MHTESKSLSNQNQHFIPKSFLNEFTVNREGWFHELNIRTNRIQEIHSRNACRITNFYDINDDMVLKRYRIDSRYLESSFAYESSLSKILKKIRNTENYLIRQEVQTVVEAYVSMKHRTPYFRNQLSNNKIVGEVLDTTIRNFKEENSDFLKFHNFNYDEFAEKFKSETLDDPDRPRTHQLTGLVETSRNENTAVTDAIIKILRMNISILEANKQDYFLVSDNPGFSLDGLKMFNTNYGKFHKIYFPINSKQMILFEGFNFANYINPLVRLNYFTVPSSFVNEVNRLTKLIADEVIYCENRDYLVRFRSSF